jgi:hypothetical protein
MPQPRRSSRYFAINATDASMWPLGHAESAEGFGIEEWEALSSSEALSNLFSDSCLTG